MNERKDIKIQQIIAALEYLKRTAEKEDLEDIVTLIDATFTICCNTYVILKRSEVASRIKDYADLKIVS